MAGRPAAADVAHRGQARESRLEALYAAALLVDGHEQRRRADAVDFGDQARELFRAFVVAREQDHAADERMRKEFALLGLERDAGDIDHDRAEAHRAWPSRDTACRRSAGQSRKGSRASRKL